nr:twin-arginine translocation signal domain-containing protein [Opitutaceae bacterium]
MSSLSRRAFVKTSALTAASLPLASLLRAKSEPGNASASTPANTAPALPGRAPLNWLEGVPAHHIGAAVGVPWPRGTVKAGAPFALRTAEGADIPVQSWPLATWPDGSLKWTGHAIPADAGRVEKLVLAPGHAPAAPATPLAVRETADAIEIDTGVITCVVPRSGPQLVSALRRAGRDIAVRGRLVSLRKDQPDTVTPAEAFTSEIESVTIEQRGPVRAVVRIAGRQRSESGERRWLPFTVRLYLHAGGDAVRVMHSFVYDGDEYKDFIAGLGLRFEVPLPDAPHDRHVRFSGEDDGLFGEAVRGVTGLRRDPGEAVRRAQVAGLPTPPLAEWARTVSDRLHLVPAWGDFTLAQLSSDGFEIRKRTQPGHGWIKAAAGRRAPGLGYIGGASGGLVFGIREFWEKYPAQLDIRSAHTDTAEITAWLWSPEAQPMDIRFYHDGMGMDTHPEEIEGLNITYEDYEKDFGTPHGIARSHELVFRAVAATP